MTENSNANSFPKTKFVSSLPDLITEEDYLMNPTQKKIRLQISVSDEGIDVLGDSMYASLVEELMNQLGAEEIERILCG